MSNYKNAAKKTFYICFLSLMMESLEKQLILLFGNEIIIIKEIF